MNAFMDSQITDAQFEAERKRMKFLHDCKTKGFKALERSGQIEHSMRPEPSGKDVKKPQYKEAFRVKILKQALKRYKAGETTDEIAASFDICKQTLLKWSKTYNMPFPRKLKITICEQDRIISLVNKDGYRLTEACRMRGFSIFGVRNAIEKRGFKYNKQKGEFERV